MIKLENTGVVGGGHAIIGMRNPKNSWNRSDSAYGCEYGGGSCTYCSEGDCDAYTNSGYIIGPKDHELMLDLAAGGPVHAKYRRMIAVYVDITAPLYWWKEFDTYKVGTVANSCSTMHKIHDKEFTWDDFSWEHLLRVRDCKLGEIAPTLVMETTINALNYWRKRYLVACKTEEETGLSAKDIWWQMIQLLPSSYNQKRTIMLNYEVLVGIYKWRKNHKLDEWREFSQWIESLPYSELITGNVKED